MHFTSTAAMYTLKQLEAFYWSSELGSFSASSRKLHTTQSAVAKRVGELEAFLARRCSSAAPRSWC